jgi:hypothetical protein
MADGSGAVPLQRVVNNLDEGLARIIPGEKAVAAVNNAAAPDGWIEVVGDFRDVPAFQDGEPLLFAQRWGRVGNVLNAPAGGTAYVDVWGDFTAFGYVAGGVIRLRSNPGAGEFTIVGDLVSLGGGQGTRFYVAEEISGATIDGFVVMPQAALADFTIAAAPTFDPETKRTRFKLAETLAGASAPDASIVLPHPSSETWIPFPAVVNSKPPFTAAATVAGPPANVAAMLHRLYQTVDSVHGDVAANGAYAAWLWRHPYAIFFEDDWAALVDP